MPSRMPHPTGRMWTPLLALAIALGAAACTQQTDTDAGDSTNGGPSGAGMDAGDTMDGGPSAAGTKPVVVQASVTNVTAKAFALTLHPSVPNITPGDLKFVPAVNIEKATATTSMSSAHYAVETATPFTLGETYTLTITKPPHTIQSPTVLWDGEAGITKMTLTVQGVALEGTITDSNIRFPNAARDVDGGVTLTGTVSLMLSEGARVLGTTPNDTTQTYTDSATNISVQTAGRRTTRGYNVAATAYDAGFNPYGVYTVDELHDVRNELDGGYLLMKDLTLPDTVSDCTESFKSQTDYCEKGFQPIGTKAAPFTGTFDGNGHRIDNVFIHRDSTTAVGLFGVVAAPASIRHLGARMAKAGVTGKEAVGGLVGQLQSGTVSNAYAVGTATGISRVGGLLGHVQDGTVSNAYATGAAIGSSSVGGLVGYVQNGTVKNAYATAAVFGRDAYVGGLVGYIRQAGGTITNSYYPTKRPAGGGGTGQATTATQNSFQGFTFTGDAPAWKWVADKWPQLTGFEAMQKTPNLAAHEAEVKSTSPAPSPTGFGLTLTPALDGLTKDDWALYHATTSAPVSLTQAPATQSSGADYTFQVTLTANTSYRLLVKKPDVVVVPPASARPAGHMTVTVPETTSNSD